MPVIAHSSVSPCVRSICSAYLHGSLPGRGTLETNWDSVQMNSCTGSSILYSISVRKQDQHQKDLPSQQHPGYLLSFHVPPTLLLFSKMIKLRHLFRLIKSIAMHIPFRELADIRKQEHKYYKPTGYTGTNDDHRRIGEVLVAHWQPRVVGNGHSERVYTRGLVRSRAHQGTS